MPVVPPIKSQGIKTKLIEWIGEQLPKGKSGRWIEPFMGTGVVGFNLTNQNGLMCDTNPHIVNFYNALKSNSFTSGSVRTYLESEGRRLLQSDGEHYYKVRERFNDHGDPLDFLFLSRSCFNGMMRFNRKGGFNVPFCKKPNRFQPALVTKIVNQVAAVAQIIESKSLEFCCQPFEKTIAQATSDDLIYADPPYIGRHSDYFNTWDENCEVRLRDCLLASKATFLLSTWFENRHRVNECVFSIWGEFFIQTREHFYFVGAKEQNRNSIQEALISNKPLPGFERISLIKKTRGFLGGF